MWTLDARPSAMAAAILLLSFANQPTFARGSQVGHDDPWNSERVDRLPPEVRKAIIHMCGDPRAGHYFATYFDNSHLIKLHFLNICTATSRQCFAGEAVVSTRNIFLPAAAFGS